MGQPIAREDLGVVGSSADGRASIGADRALEPLSSPSMRAGRRMRPRLLQATVIDALGQRLPAVELLRRAVNIGALHVRERRAVLRPARRWQGYDALLVAIIGGTRSCSSSATGRAAKVISEGVDPSLFSLRAEVGPVESADKFYVFTRAARVEFRKAQDLVAARLPALPRHATAQRARDGVAFAVAPGLSVGFKGKLPAARRARRATGMLDIREMGRCQNGLDPAVGDRPRLRAQRGDAG